MQNAAIELFYVFFQGILTFQVLFFTVLYIITKRKDLLNYCLFLFFAAAYFFINAPFTLFGIPEDVVWHSWWYNYFNTPVIIIENLFYLLFLRAFFADITFDKSLKGVFRFTLALIPVIVALFVLLTMLRMNKQFIFYTVKLLTVLPAILITYVVLKRKLPFYSLVAIGLICTIIGTCVTVCMIVLGNNGIHGLFTEGYPLFFIRLGILGDMIIYMTAIMQKWHLQEKQSALQKVQAELAVEKVRTKIFGELHDDLGSTLSGISMYSYLANDFLQSGEYGKAKHSLGIIQRSTAQLVSNLSDLVWTINPKQESFETLLDRLRQYGTEICAARHISFTAICPDPLLKKIVNIDVRHEIYLFLKEAINNAAKHSDATSVELIFTETGDYLEFSVRDNGTGFDPGKVRRGNGLENMFTRSDEIGAKLVLQSKPGERTLVSLQIKTK